MAEMPCPKCGEPMPDSARFGRVGPSNVGYSTSDNAYRSVTPENETSICPNCEAVVQRVKVGDHWGPWEVTGPPRA